VDILVNCTSIGLFPKVSEMPPADLEKARADLLVCDVVPNPAETRFIKAARARGLKTLTGLPMLVGQGAIGFEMWTGRPAPEAAMKAALAKAFE
jgi:shikimate dehydrogenase